MNKDTVKLKRPCEEHKIAFPSNDVKSYPEIRYMSYSRCQKCGWYICYTEEDI